MLEIEWDSDDVHGRRRRKASTIHGWLCMWRGTLIGNERVRQRGRREMKEARAVRAYYRQRAQENGGNGPFSLFRLGSGTRKANAAAPSTPAPPRQPQRHRSHSSQHHHHHHHSGNPPQKRPPPVKRKSSSKSSRHAAPARQEPMRQRSSHSAKSKPSPSRRPSSSRR